MKIAKIETQKIVPEASILEEDLTLFIKQYEQSSEIIKTKKPQMSEEHVHELALAYVEKGLL